VDRLDVRVDRRDGLADDDEREDEERAAEDGREVREGLLERLDVLDAVDRFGGSLDSARFEARTRARQASPAMRRFRFRPPLPETLILWIRLRVMIASFCSWRPGRIVVSISSDADLVPMEG
jgi:hypothetical protein